MFLAICVVALLVLNSMKFSHQILLGYLFISCESFVKKSRLFTTLARYGRLSPLLNKMQTSDGKVEEVQEIPTAARKDGSHLVVNIFPTVCVMKVCT